MRYILLLTAVTLTAITPQTSFGAQAQEAKGQSCHMEQQCHWENFKKVCVYVKVCR
jgi:Spy/CpxP family protein refolding chaperone